MYETPSPITTSSTSDFGESVTVPLGTFINKEENEEILVEVQTTHNFVVEIDGETVTISGSSIGDVGSNTIEFMVIYP